VWTTYVVPGQAGTTVGCYEWSVDVAVPHLAQTELFLLPARQECPLSMALYAGFDLDQIFPAPLAKTITLFMFLFCNRRENVHLHK
jgi:hypothetical protein